MGKSSPSAPPPPDYVGAAKEQGAANIETARLQGLINNPNIYGPLGDQTVTWAGDQPTIRQTLTPDAMAALQSQQGVQRDLSGLAQQGIGTARDILGREFQPGGGTPLQTGFDTSNLARMPVNAGMTGQDAIMARLQPQIERQQRSTAQTLANQGLVSGGEAYTNAMRDQSMQQNDLLSQAALQGINLDMGARAQGFNELGQQMGMQNAAQQSELQRQAYLRQQPLNEITGLMSGSQIQMPQFQGYQGSNIAPPPIMAGAQAQGQAAMNQYGIQSANVNAQNAGTMGMLGTLGAGAMMATRMF